MTEVADSWRRAKTELHQRIRDESVERSWLVLGAWSFYRVSGLHARHFVGVELAVNWLDWPKELRHTFLDLWLPLQRNLARANGMFWRWPVSTCEVQAQDLAAFVRQQPQLISSLPAAMELFFARLFLLAGQVDLYFLYRSNFIARLAESDETLVSADESLADMYGMALANEQYSSLEALELNQNLRKKMTDQPLVQREFLDFACFYLPRTYSDYSLSWTWSSADNAFAYALQGKRLAIVGPVEVGLDSGAEIDGFDLVIRLNHRASNALCPRYFGSRTDISYYIDDDLKRATADNYLSAMIDMQFVVLSSECQFSFPWLEMLGERLRTRLEVGTYRRNPFLVGYPSAVQRVLMDVLRFAPSEVKVFNMDLYLGRKYGGSYFQPVAGYTFYPGFTLHDPLSNFVFMQRAWLGGWFKADPVLAEVLRLPMVDYQAAFFRVHGNSDSR